MICLFLNGCLINNSIVILNIYTQKYKLFASHFKFYLQMMEFWFCIFVYKRCKRQLHNFLNFFEIFAEKKLTDKINV